LKHKKIRLTITILLSCVAFVLFGLADTFASYNHVKTSAKSIIDTNIGHLSLQKHIKVGDGIIKFGIILFKILFFPIIWIFKKIFILPLNCKRHRIKCKFP